MLDVFRIKIYRIFLDFVHIYIFFVLTRTRLGVVFNSMALYETGAAPLTYIVAGVLWLQGNRFVWGQGLKREPRRTQWSAHCKRGIHICK